jgi:hypothetical protein
MNAMRLVRAALVVALLGCVAGHVAAQPPGKAGKFAADKAGKIGAPAGKDFKSAPASKIDLTPAAAKPAKTFLPPAAATKPDKKVKLSEIVTPGDFKFPKPLPEVKGKSDKKVMLPDVAGKIGVTPKILTTPSLADAKDLKAPGLKLPAGTKISAGELAKIKPPIDLTKVKADKVMGMKPPADFKMKPIGLDKIHLPKDAPAMEKLSAKLLLGGGGGAAGKFIVNPKFWTGGDYHLKFGVKSAFGWCYHGIHHCHWHHCIWDPCFGCHYYYDPCLCCYYYWCPDDVCYYPCWWFVDHCSHYYPWWLCSSGGFDHFGYHPSGFGVHIHIGF